MAPHEHLEFLKECLAENDIQKWNDWMLNTEGLPEDEIVRHTHPQVRKVNLEGASLFGANLEGADLRGADLRGADLRGADLRGANLWEANLFGANLEGVNLVGANLEGANLREANLGGAYLEGADLRGAYLRGAYLEGAYLEGADLEGAYLRGADLRGADLTEANLFGANLEGANLRGANLRRAYLRGVYLDLDIQQRKYAKKKGVIFSEEQTTSELAAELRARDQLTQEIELINQEKVRIQRDKEKAENEKKALDAEIARLREEKANEESLKQMVIKLQEKERTLEKFETSLKEKSNEISRRETLQKELDKKTDQKIEKAINHLQRPNKYLDKEVELHKKMFRWYLRIACVLGCIVGIMAFASFCSYNNIHILGFHCIFPLLPTDVNLYGYLFYQGPQLTLIGTFILFVNLFTRTRRRIHELEERKRNVETLLGILFAIKGLSDSSEKIVGRIDSIMKELSTIAVEAFLNKSKLPKIKGAIEQIKDDAMEFTGYTKK